MSADWLAALQLGLSYGLILSILSVGPAFFLILQTSILRGWKMALALELGIILSDITCVGISYWGASSLLEILEGNKYIGPTAGGILIAYGLLKIINKQEIPPKDLKTPKQKGFFTVFLRGYFLNIINPGLLLYWFTIVGLGLEALKRDHLLADELLKINIFFTGTIIAVIFSIDLLKILFAQKLGKVLKPNSLEKIDLVLSFVFMGMGACFVIKSFL